MTRQVINLGTADKGNGDPIRTAFGKVNDNFAEIYAILGNNASGTTITTDVIGSVFADDSTKIVDGVNGTLHGRLIGDVEGSVFADDSTKLIDGITGKIVGPIQTSVSNVSITGGTNGQVLTTNGSGTLSWTSISSSGITASSSDTLTNKTINIATGQGNTFQIQGNSITSYSGSGAVIALTTMPTLNAFNIGNGSNLTVDGGTGVYYWNGQSGIAEAGIDKAGVYRSSSSATNSLFTFASNGSGTMSAAVEGSLFIGSVLPSNNGGLSTAYSGWLVVQSGAKFGGDLNTLGGLHFDDNTTGYIRFQNGNVCKIVSAPAHQYGQNGDVAGMTAYDAEYFYWCYQNYVDNSTACWRRVARSLTSW